MTPKVESLALYGGVDVEAQAKALSGAGDDGSEGRTTRRKSLVAAATPGRLLDLLRRSAPGGGRVSSAFADLRAVVFDEADRMAVNADMAGQVDEILSLLKVARKKGEDAEDGRARDVVSCLVSATLPEKAGEACEQWVPRPRIAVRVDSVRLGRAKEGRSANELDATTAGEDGGARDDDDEGPVEREEGEPSEKRKGAEQGLDLARIPPAIVHTLHVCSQHKKPRKLIVTLQRIYLKKDAANDGGGRFTTNNRLTIVFFAQIKTVKYVSKLLAREGLRCVELYGSLDQGERERRLLEFRAGETSWRWRLLSLRAIWIFSHDELARGRRRLPRFSFADNIARQNSDNARDGRRRQGPARQQRPLRGKLRLPRVPGSGSCRREYATSSVLPCLLLTNLATSPRSAVRSQVRTRGQDAGRRRRGGGPASAHGLQLLHKGVRLHGRFRRGAPEGLRGAARPEPAGSDEGGEVERGEGIDEQGVREEKEGESGGDCER